ncbi:MAG: hypothetical protein JNK82_41900 [Myxococcaceae bacterium]|nr:hypothetical protein [Myxococcaceae bacterium]
MAPQPTPQSPEQLMNKALNGTLTASDAAQLKALLSSDAGRDAFSPEQRQDLQRFVEGTAPTRDARELHSDLRLLKGANEVAGRFAADLVLAHGALLEHASLLRGDKATRLFEFAVPYAQTLLQLAQSDAELRKAAQALLAEANKAGFAELQQEPGNKTGLEALAMLLKAGSPEEAARLAQGLRFDAPVWPKDAVRQTDKHAAGDGQLQTVQPKPGEPAVMRPLPQVMMEPVPIQKKADSEKSRRDDGTSKRLGPMMLWNVLHGLRDDGEGERDSAAQREALTQLAVAAGLILVFLAVVVGVLVAM